MSLGLVMALWAVVYSDRTRDIRGLCVKYSLVP
jgi:hypothetical protein